MRRVFGARRDAEELQGLLERPVPGTPGSSELERLATLTGTLRELPPVEADPEFVADLRRRLMVEVATVLAPQARSDPAESQRDVRARLTVPHGRTRRERRIATLIGGAAVIGATTSMAVASQSAVPGDVLYPVKRAIENAHTGVSIDDRSKGSTLLANARGRLEEAEALSVREDDYREVRAIEETLSTFSDQAAEASELLMADYEARGEQESLEQLQTFTADSFDRLDHLASQLPEDARDALVGAGDVLAGIEEALRQLCPTCEVSLTEMPQWLVAQAGPVLGTLLPPAIPQPGAPGPERGTKAGPDRTGVQPQSPALEQPRPPEQPIAPEDLLPGADLPDPGAGNAPGGPSGTRTKGPVGGLVEDLTTPPPGVPALPILPELLQGVGDLVDGLTAPLRPPRTPAP